MAQHAARVKISSTLQVATKWPGLKVEVLQLKVDTRADPQLTQQPQLAIQAHKSKLLKDL